MRKFIYLSIYYGEKAYSILLCKVDVIYSHSGCNSCFPAPIKNVFRLLRLLTVFAAPTK